MDSQVITIDGPAGSGKSTAARSLAKRLGFEFLDTGAMYRCVAWKCREAGIDLEDEVRVAEVAEQIRIHFSGDTVIVDSTDVTEAIRSVESSEGSSVVARNTVVRDNMGRLQRAAAAGHRIVTEGRDQGTVVFPDAVCKFFLTADSRTRAERRCRELRARGIAADLDEILEQIHTRDRRDVERAVAPLKPAEDALQLDTSGMSADEVVDELERQARERIEADDLVADN